MRTLALAAVLALIASGCGARSPLDPLSSPNGPGLVDAGTPLDPGMRDASIPRDAHVDGATIPLDDGGRDPGEESPRVEIVSAGWRHSCALRAGRALCWGNNASGQLGDGTYVDRDAPVEVMHDEAFAEISAGMQHTCARTRRGEIWCWGHNLHGQIGVRLVETSTTNRPVRVPGITGARGVSAAGQHTCAVLADRSATCWGHGAFGQLGHGDTSSTTTPMRVVALDRIEQIEAGWRHTCAVRDDGSVWCWGQNLERQLGVERVEAILTPVQVPGVVDAVQVSAGTHHTCALLATERVSCWGSMGPAGRAEGPFPPHEIAGLARALQVGAGERGRSCVVHDDGSLGCFPVLLPHFGADVRVGAFGARRYSIGFEHACVALEDGGVACFGEDDFGQLGDGAPRVGSSAPVRVLGF
ncbi:RCC1 domain-containing protein [Sandaracinus amylolyticus]|uniref:BNR repeat domain protein n=1 Tax=Sandaracinus amylolyticus TaxID=927083 RepID=A0A0F6SEG5_9BACT|nr:hypothetical protein [Sandaracinus amylolyticus]AKF05154.1 BNR repeat domain protein [Sandaracinus amylolyticus]